MVRAMWLPAVVAVVVVSACGESTSPGGITAMQAQPCEQNPEMCGGGGGGGGGGYTGDPAPSAPGIFIGQSFTAASCISPSGAGINDADYDGLDDYCEHIIALQFRPAMSFSSLDCNTGGERYWAAKVFPAQGNLVRIAYLPSYYQDCGTPTETGCDMIGECGSHVGDSEFIILDLRFNTTTLHWYLVRAFLSAHSHFPVSAAYIDQSMNLPGNFAASAFTYPARQQGFPRVWVAQGKHANYPSRTACNDGGWGGYDTCDSNPDSWVQLDHSRWHNVGSIQANMINTGTCVTGGKLVATYPENYGIECYWVANDDFQGWYTSTAMEPATPYYNWLFSSFECYSYPLKTVYFNNTVSYMADFGWVQANCTDWGLRR
jgi:hypothetical protein